MPAHLKKSPEIVEKFLELLRGGKYLYQACAECNLGDTTIAHWRAQDADFERQYWDARRFAVEREMESLKTKLDQMDVKERNEILRMKEQLAQARWEAERLIPQYHNTVKAQVDAKVEKTVEHVITFSAGGFVPGDDAKVVEGSGVKELEADDRAQARPVPPAA